MTEKLFMKESEKFLADNASSWFIQETKVGEDDYISMTFLKYIHKIIIDEEEVITGDSHLHPEAIATISLTTNSARVLAESILLRINTKQNGN